MVDTLAELRQRGARAVLPSARPGDHSPAAAFPFFA
jgi:hypothetical protein